jgi:putative membrane protein
MEYFSAIQAAELISTIFYTFIGVALMGVIWKVIDWLTPFPIMKEIEQDQNIALAVLIGFLFLSISIIIAAVILS